MVSRTSFWEKNTKYRLFKHRRKIHLGSRRDTSPPGTRSHRCPGPQIRFPLIGRFGLVARGVVYPPQEPGNRIQIQVTNPNWWFGLVLGLELKGSFPLTLQSGGLVWWLGWGGGFPAVNPSQGLERWQNPAAASFASWLTDPIRRLLLQIYIRAARFFCLELSSRARPWPCLPCQPCFLSFGRNLASPTNSGTHDRPRVSKQH